MNEIKPEILVIKGVSTSRETAERLGQIRCRHGFLYPDLTCDFCIKENKMQQNRKARRKKK